MYFCANRKAFFMIRAFTIFIGFLIFISCSTKKSDNAYSGNIEELLPWIDHSGIKEINQPDHSYAVFVDTTREFSYGFKAFYKDIRPKNPKKVEVSCNVFTYNLPNQVQLVFEMKENDTTILWKSEKINNGKVAQWNKLVLKADIPQNLPANVLIQVYLWSPAKEAALADNFLIKFE